jgi:hypothetical protein
MNKLISILFLFLFASLGCRKVHVPVSSVISGLSIINDTLYADGVSMDTLAVNLNPAADMGMRFVRFTCSVCSFVGGQQDTVSSQAFYNNNLLTAKAYFIAPQQPGTLYFTAAPQITGFDSYNDYILYDSLAIAPSIAAFIDLESSSQSIDSNFQSQISLKAVLKNASLKPVSLGVNVLFEDDIPGPPIVHGRFSTVSSVTDTSSSVTALYSVGNVAVGSSFYIRATVLNPNLSRTSIVDSILIQVVQ